MFCSYRLLPAGSSELTKSFAYVTNQQPFYPLDVKENYKIIMTLFQVCTTNLWPKHINIVQIISLNSFRFTQILAVVHAKRKNFHDLNQLQILAIYWLELSSLAGLRITDSYHWVQFGWMSCCQNWSPFCPNHCKSGDLNAWKIIIFWI